MIAGYCWPQSGVAGEQIELHISADAPTCTVTVARVGGAETEVAAYDNVAVSEQPVPDDASVNGCRWDATLTITVGADWDTGFHLIRMTTPAGETAEAFLVVRPVEPTGDALLVLSTSTWAAYNDWGGPSFYTGGVRSSQLRPLPPGFLDKPRPEYFRMAHFQDMPREDRHAHFADYSIWSCAAGFANWEKLFVAWAEREGLKLDYATSQDLAREPDILAGYSTYVSVGHDEYWSASMRDHVESWVDDGGLAVFLSGNTAFWQVRYEGDADEPEHQVVGYKLDFDQDPVLGTDDQQSLATMWSDPLVGRPESEMTGVTFTRGGYAHVRGAPRGTGGYSIWQPDHWVFDGLDMRAGDILGGDPVIVGYECDGCELQLVDGLPQATGSGGTPDNFQVLGTAPAHLWATEEGAPGLPDTYVGELNWVAERLGGEDTPENRARFAHGAAVIGTYTRGQGTVFTVGCTDWAYGLTDPTVAMVTRNVLGRNLDRTLNGS